jgi:hypothetical protein
VAEIKPDSENLPRVKAVRLGKIAVVLLPIEKLKQRSPRDLPFEQEFHEFLFTNFSGYTVASGNISGHWSDDSGRDHYGEHRQYTVAVAAVEAIRVLEVFLATLAREMGEQCIYLEFGQEAFLIDAAEDTA